MTAVRVPFGKPLGWTLAVLVVIGLSAISWIYWPAVGKAGVLPPEDDSIMIPMMGSIFLSVVLLPIVCLITWLCLRGNDGAGSLLAWDRARPIRSAVVSICFALPFCFGVFSLVDELAATPGWYGLWWSPYTLIALSWLASMRGSALSKRKNR
jgi:hypothetical protein